MGNKIKQQKETNQSTAEYARKEAKELTAEEQPPTSVSREAKVQKETIKSNNNQLKSVCRVEQNNTDNNTKDVLDGVHIGNTEGDLMGSTNGELDGELDGEQLGNNNGELDGEQHGEDCEDLEMSHITQMWQDYDQQEHFNERMMKTEYKESSCPTTPVRNTAPGSLLYEIERPSSPTGINDFPFFPTTDLSDIEWKVGNSTLPKFKSNKTVLNTMVEDCRDTQEWYTEIADENSIPRQVQQYTVIADMGTYGRTFKICKSKVGTNARGDLADSGANCSMTANLKALVNLRKLEEPIIIGLAISNDGTLSLIHI